MQMQGERSIKADRDTVWKALNDPEVLKASIPGCEELEQTSDTTFEGKVKQKIGPVNARFAIAVELSEVIDSESYRISGEGKGGAAGFAKGGARVRLKDEGDGTLLSFDAEAKVGGKLAQLGSRVIDGYARKMSDEFFDRFKKQVEPADAPSSEDPGGAERDETKNAAEETTTEKTTGRESGQGSAGKAAGGSSAGSTGGARAGASGGGSWLDRVRAWFRQLFG